MDDVSQLAEIRRKSAMGLVSNPNKTVRFLLDRMEKLEGELKVSDKLIDNRNVLVDKMPCPAHGRCIPYAIERVAKLEAVASAANGLMSEDDAMEALSHFNCLFILKEALKEIE